MPNLKEKQIQEIMAYVRSIHECKQDYQAYEGKKRYAPQQVDLLERICLMAKEVVKIFEGGKEVYPNPPRKGPARILTPENKVELASFADAQQAFAHGSRILVELHDEYGIYGAQVFSKNYGDTMSHVCQNPRQTAEEKWYLLPEEDIQ